ncbi:MAG: hypothetical protein KF729_20465 [Sandaracinaceae bacterium]|nr:hypothetical protein [Sandaracinaceae bacterium]
MEREGGDRLVESVESTRVRARRVGALARWLDAMPYAALGGAALAAARGLVWPSGALDPALAGTPRAAILSACGALATAAIAALVAYRRARMPPLAAARAIDAHLGLTDVVASGHALSRDAAPGPAAALAIERARRAVSALDPAAVFPVTAPSWRPRRALLGALALVVGVAIGTLDGAVVSALVTPPTPEERAAAEALEAAARALEEEIEAREETRAPRPDPARTPDPERAADRALAAQARAAAAAAQRGDRDAALSALRAIEAAREGARERARSTRDSLAALASALGAPPRATGSEATPTAADQARELARLLRPRADEVDPATDAQRRAEERRALERLERAAERAARRGEDGLAEALRRARDALSGGDRDGAAQALEGAAGALDQLEDALAEARSALARRASLDALAAEVERTLQLARLGRETDEGEDADAFLDPRRGSGGPPSEGASSGTGARPLSAAILDRLTALGLAEGPTVSPRGSGGGPRRTGRPERAVPVERAAHAPSHVERAGTRAVAALEGLGRSGDPSEALREVYPSYGVDAEEALASERIPAARRRTVRRYFESIRPDQDREEVPR